MNVSPILALPTDTTALQVTRGGRDFKELLQQKTGAQASAADSDLIAREKNANEAATGLVSNALILPILQQFRRSMGDAKGPFSQGKAEKTFGPQFDMQLADRIAQSPKLGIKTALANRLLRRGQPAAANSAATGGQAAGVTATAAHKDLDVHG